MASGAWRSHDAYCPPRRTFQRSNDLRREFDEPRQDEASGANLDYRNVVLAQVLLERQVRIAGEEHVEDLRPPREAARRSTCPANRAR